jgi:hypothetical protein
LDTPMEPHLHKPNRLWQPGRVMGDSPDTRRTLLVDNFQTSEGASSRYRAANSWHRSYRRFNSASAVVTRVCGGPMRPLSGSLVIHRRFPSVGPPPLCPKRSNAGLSDAIRSGLLGGTGNADKNAGRGSREDTDCTNWHGVLGSIHGHLGIACLCTQPRGRTLGQTRISRTSTD